MYIRKSVRIAKIHLQCSGVWENIKRGLLHIQVKISCPNNQNLLKKNVIKSDESTASGSKEWGSFEPNKSDNQSKLNQ